MSAKQANQLKILKHWDEDRGVVKVAFEKIHIPFSSHEENASEPALQTLSMNWGKTISSSDMNGITLVTHSFPGAIQGAGIDI